MTGPNWSGLVGAELAGYRVHALLGSGGLVNVYRAEDIRLGRTVALKVLAADVADSESFRRRFLEFCRQAAALEHPNIVPIYDAGEADGMLYLAMRYVEGTNLRSMLIGNRKLGAEYLVGICSQVADALDAAHAMGLVHQDVKPANILISSDAAPNQEGHVYISDFGTGATNAAAGSNECLAPEQIRGADVTPQVDIYGLACVVYQALTGSLPPEPVDSRTPVGSLDLNLQPRVREVLAKALAFDPWQRYPTCGEFIDELSASLGTEDGSVDEAPAPERVELSAKRPRRPGGILIAIGVVLAIAATVVIAKDVFHFGSDDRFAGTEAMPIAFDYPRDWQQSGDDGTGPVFSPGATDVAMLLTERGGADNWSSLRKILDQDPAKVLGLFILVSPGAARDPSDVDGVLRTGLPTNLTFSGTASQAAIGDATGLERSAEVTDPGAATTRLRLLCFSAVIDSRTVTLVFFSSPQLFEYRRQTFQKVVDSVHLLR